MAAKGLTVRLTAFGAVAFTLIGIVGGVALRPVVDAAVEQFAPADENGRNQDRNAVRDPGAAPSSPNARRGGFSSLPAITTATIEPATIERRIDVVGAGRSRKSVTLTAEATGLVKDVRIKPGKKVAAGDLLVQIDDTEQRLELARLKAQYPIAKANSERYADLLANNAASKIEAETAFNTYKTVEASLKAAEFAVSQRAIRAPFAGVVGLTTIETGDYVRAGDIATTIDDLSSLIVEFAVPQESAGDIELGQSVSAALVSSRSKVVTGSVTAIDSRVDPASRTLKIEATFSNSDGGLIPGATYAVSTVNAGAPAVSVPGLAVQWDRTGSYVWKLAKDGAVSRAGVVILQRRDEIAVIDGDVSPGEVVIVEGADRVRPGMTFPQSNGVSNGVGGARSAGAL